MESSKCEIDSSYFLLAKPRQRAWRSIKNIGLLVNCKTSEIQRHSWSNPFHMHFAENFKDTRFLSSLMPTQRRFKYRSNRSFRSMEQFIICFCVSQPVDIKGRNTRRIHYIRIIWRFFTRIEVARMKHKTNVTRTALKPIALLKEKWRNKARQITAEQWFNKLIIELQLHWCLVENYEKYNQVF